MKTCLGAWLLMACTLTFFLFCTARVRGGDVELGWSPSSDARVTGYNLYYGLNSGDYTWGVNARANLTVKVAGLTPGLVYYFAVTAYDANGDQSWFSNEITNRLPIPPRITAQPLTQTAIAGAPATLAVSAAGDPPLSFQWMNGPAPIPGGTSSVLSWPQTGDANAGNYTVIVSNPWGSVTSSVAILTVLDPPVIVTPPQSPTVLPTNTIASAAGAYNGLFFQTNADGTADVTEATAGLFGNCVLDSNGVFSAKVYVGGSSWPLAGAFDAAGNASATISRLSSYGGPGLSNLTVILHLDLIHGTRQMTGAISSATAGNNPWTAPLVADLAANAFPQLASVSLWMSPGLSANSPANYGEAGGPVVNGALSLSGMLGDTAAISQTAPISKDGNVPLYLNLYNNSGLIEGWVNLAGGVVSGSLTWIRPGGVFQPAGFPLGFNTVVRVTGATSSR